MSKLVSIIIPFYNVENYLTECLNSVIKQSYINTEIILVDDGSTDSSKKIAETFQHTYKDRNIVLLEKKNGGQSSARNFGVSHASGEYVVFVDSDDYITPIHIEELVSGVETYAAKVAMCKFTKNLDELNNSITHKPQNLKGSFVFLIEELYKSEFPSVSAWAKIYHKSLFEKIKFVEGIIYEDGLFFYELIDQIDNIVLIDSASYYYRTAENSTLTNKISLRNFDVLKKNQLTEKFFKNKHPEAMTHFYQKALNLNDFIAVKCVQDKTDLSNQLIDELYQVNKGYSKDFFPRKLLYSSKVNYRFFLSVMSKVYQTNNSKKNSYVKQAIKKVIK